VLSLAFGVGGNGRLKGHVRSVARGPGGRGEAGQRSDFTLNSDGVTPDELTSAVNFVFLL
jgi:hypothetical protein